jgi:hypothetical protein
MSSYKTFPKLVLEFKGETKPEPPRWLSWRVTVIAGALTSAAVFSANLGLLLIARQNLETNSRRKYGIAERTDLAGVKGRVTT